MPLFFPPEVRNLKGRRMTKPYPKHVLMTARWEDEQPTEIYTVITPQTFDHYADEWFTVPEPLARAYQNALATVEYLEANLEAYRQKTGHRKRFR